jgi:hypothetical protein
MPRTQSADWSVDDDISAVHLQEMNEDMDDLYSQGSDRLRVVRAASGVAAKIDIGAGAFRVADTHGTYAGGTDIAVTLSQTNYVQIDAAGAIQINTSAWNASYARLAIVVCNGSGITSITLWKTDAVGGLLAGSVTVNTQTLAATFTMTTADKKYQYLDPDGAARIVTLPSSGAAEGDSFFIKNSGDDQYMLNVQTSSVTIKALRSGESCMFVYNGSAWKTMLGDLPDFTVFGDGRDGAGSYTGSSQISNTKVWNWDSLTISSSGVVTVATANSPLIARVRGDVTIDGILDLDYMGSTGGAAFGNFSNAGNTGATVGHYMASPFTLPSGITLSLGGVGGGRDASGNNGVSGGAAGGGASMFTAGSAGSGGTSPGAGGSVISSSVLAYLQSYGFGIVCSAGGGSGGSPGGSGGNNTTGYGGNGAGAALFYIYGNLTIGASATIRARGQAGNNGQSNPNGWNDHCGPGGGGGGGTIIFIVYGVVTVGAGTFQVTGGAGGSNNSMTGGAGAAGKIIAYNPMTGVITSIA